MRNFTLGIEEDVNIRKKGSQTRPIWNDEPDVVQDPILGQSMKGRVVWRYDNKCVVLSQGLNRTSVASGEANGRTGQKLCNLFIPSAVNPTTGFLLLIP